MRIRISRQLLRYEIHFFGTQPFPISCSLLTEQVYEGRL